MTYQTPRLVHRIALAAAHAAAWLIALRHDLIHHELTAEECEARGLEEGATEPAIHLHLDGAPRWWRLDVWTEPDPEQACLCFDALGQHARIYYRPRGPVFVRG